MKEEIKNLQTSTVLYRLKCSKNTECENPKVVKTNKGRIMLCAVCDGKKLRFIKERGASGLLSKPLSKGPLLGEIFF